jgi:hemerythrin-like domain-containing protein
MLSVNEQAPDFSNPLGLLSACHNRILQHCDLLQRLLDHIGANGIDDDTRKAAQQVVRYFSTAGKLHHEDEEQDLFPRLVRTSLEMAELIHGLEQDHERLDDLWAELSVMLDRPAAIDDLDKFASLAQEFISANREHVNRENNDLLSIAPHMISEKDQKKIGAAMAERRGVSI